MAVITTTLTCELQEAVKVQYLNGNIFSQDNQANVIKVNVFNNGSPATLTGTISANITRQDGGTVAATGGSISGNVASITLPAAAYAVPGGVSIVIKNTNSSVVTTIAAIVANVYQSSTDTVVDPGTIIPSIQTLISSIETAVASIPADYSSLWTSLAPAFSSSATYAAGQYVTYNGGLYRFTTAHSGAWSSSDVVSVNIGGELSDLKSALDHGEESIENGLQQITGDRSLVFKNGVYRAASTSPGTGTNVYYAESAAFVCAICPCAKDDIFNVHVYGASQAYRAYYVLDSSMNILKMAGSNKNQTAPITIDEANAAYIVFNNAISNLSTGYYAYKVGSTSTNKKVSALEGDIDRIDNDILDLRSSIKYQYDNEKTTDIVKYIAYNTEWTDGIYYHKNGYTSESGSYKMSNIITLEPLQVLKLDSLQAPSANVSIITVVDSSGTFVSSFMQGSNSEDAHDYLYGNITGSTQYIIISTYKTTNTTISISNISYMQFANMANGEYIDCCVPMFSKMNGYYDSSLNYYKHNNYCVSTPIKVKKGEKLFVACAGVANAAKIIKTNEYGVASEVLAMNSGLDVALTTYTPTADIYVVIGWKADDSISILKQKFKANKPGVNDFNLLTPTVTFVFDDGTASDVNAVNVFRNHKKACSFALMSSITALPRVIEYLQYQEEGFEILSHSTDARTMSGYSSADIQDEVTARQCMADSRKALQEAGFKINGWVTPSGRLKPSWVHNIKELYDYGFVLQNVNYTDDSIVPYFTRSESAYNVFRISLQNSTLAMWKQAIDLAIANGGMVVFYGHAVNETSEDNLTIENLDAVLTYLDGLDDKIAVLPCNTAMRYFFKNVHDNT